MGENQCASLGELGVAVNVIDVNMRVDNELHLLRCNLVDCLDERGVHWIEKRIDKQHAVVADKRGDIATAAGSLNHIHIAGDRLNLKLYVS